VKRLILKKASAIELRRAATMNGMVTLRMDGFRKVRDGLTTLEEVIRITGE
jgi:type II secretory ATPase GspE/PulE/Tfp pilus assembly ATPase PilB-like protein